MGGGERMGGGGVEVREGLGVKEVEGRVGRSLKSGEEGRERGGVA